MSISERLSDDLKKALKAGDKDTLSAIRMVKAAIKNKEIEKGSPLKDEDVCRVLLSYVRQRKDSIEQFSKGGRQDLVEKESRELSIIQSYLPPQLSEDEVRKLITEAVKETDANSLKDMGRVIKSVMEKAGGQVDGKLVSALVKEALEE
ncbi:MAG: GatB/YqeY domain-containing protein [Thermodesulfovibrionia bacterium]|nr:GatB/YqeY domain-containing protein [Thermodesulfovibrionia bacterium]